MTDEPLLRYVDLWTTDVHAYALIKVDPSRPYGYVILDLETNGLLLIDEHDEEVLAAIFTNMRKAGARVMTPEEARLSAQDARGAKTPESS